jgi:hypothetical protein
MSADATVILAAVKTALESAYPTIPVRVRKGRPGPGMESPLCGLKAGDDGTVFVVSCAGPEPTETQATFEHVSVNYPVNVSYVKPAEASPGLHEDDDDTRQKRAAIRNLLYRPTLTGATQVRHTGIQEGAVYEEFRDNVVRVISDQTLTFLAYEARGGTT